ncbi:hypothetical protein E2C01_061641 [Portunus trituberculatus]|uniref:Uncharacterized protein n=1 Tax=Portunus trituberculatus TaxID=210409 RepID=A0A5B7HFM5_PORTR|nr:hypothetical protein [Portunus trituberculatus]
MSGDSVAHQNTYTGETRPHPPAAASTLTGHVASDVTAEHQQQTQRMRSSRRYNHYTEKQLETRQEVTKPTLSTLTRHTHT